MKTTPIVCATVQAPGTEAGDLDKLSSEVFNLPCKMKDSDFASATDRLNYKLGHRDARHAACDLIALARPSAPATSPHAALDSAAPPVSADALQKRVLEAWANYERMGEVCSFEGNPMIYASTLEEIAALAQQGAAEQHNAVECVSALRAEPASQHDADARDAARYRWLCSNNFDRQSAQVHTWHHWYEPHSVTGEPTEWKARVRGGALDRIIDEEMKKGAQS